MNYYEAALSMMENEFTSRQFSLALKKLGYKAKTESGIISHTLKRYGIIPIRPKAKIYSKVGYMKKIDFTFNPDNKKLSFCEIGVFSDKQLLDEMTKRRLYRKFTDEELIEGLKQRGYTGTLNPPSKPIEL